MAVWKRVMVTRMIDSAVQILRDAETLALHAGEAEAPNKKSVAWSLDLNDQADLLLEKKKKVLDEVEAEIWGKIRANKDSDAEKRVDA